MGVLGTAAGSQRQSRKKKPDAQLSSVIQETAVPACLELLRSNAPFTFPSGTAWVVLVVAADDLGGLSKRHRRDEAKGSIIELVASDQIKTVATADMLALEIFGIIPTEETLERMEEFELLTGARYRWAVVWQEHSSDLVIDLADDTTFSAAKAVSSGGMALRDAVGERAWAEHSGTPLPAASTDAIADATAARAESGDGDDAIAPGGQDDDVDIFGPVPEDEPVFDTDSADIEFEEEPVQGVAPGADRIAVDPDESPFAATGGFEEHDDPEERAEAARTPTPAVDDDGALPADQDQAQEVIARRFLSEDLDLVVGLDEFNATFTVGAPVVQIDVPQNATAWLSDQVTQLTRQANADIAQLRYAHEDELRTLYITLMSVHVEQVIRDVATDRAGSRYKALKDSAEQAHAERRSVQALRVQEVQARIAQEYESQAKKLAQQAALDAEIRYTERHRPRMEREQADAAAEIERALESAHVHDREEILRVRRADAALRMQVGTTKIFELLAERQADFLAVEGERLAEWNSEIQRIVDDNRKADIAQAEALAEQQRTADELESVRGEHERLVQAMRVEHAGQISRLQDTLERHRKDAVAQLQIRDAEWRHSLGREEERTKSYIARTAELMQQLNAVESSADRRWSAYVNQLKASWSAHANELARTSDIQWRSHRILVVLMIVLSLLFCAAGFIGGVVASG